MELLAPALPPAVLAVLMLMVLRRVLRRRRSERLQNALSEVESATPMVIADWPIARRHELSCLLTRELLTRSADYRQGMHTSTQARESDHALQVRLNAALERVREAGRIADRTGHRSDG